MKATTLADSRDSYRHQQAAIRTRARKLIEPLCDKELEVLQLCARGESIAEMAKALGMTANSCKSHILRISQKTGYHGLVRLCILAMRSGLSSLWVERRWEILEKGKSGAGAAGSGAMRQPKWADRRSRSPGAPPAVRPTKQPRP